MSEEPAATPLRTAIQVHCDGATAAALARAAVVKSLHGRRGLATLGLSAALAAVIGKTFHSALAGAVTTAVVMAVLVATSVASATRAFRRMTPRGFPLVSRYDGEGRLALTTGIGTSALTRGSADRVERSQRIVAFRLRHTRRWVLLPAGLLTDEDLAFLTRAAAATPRMEASTVAPTGDGPPALHVPGNLPPPQSAHLPMMHIVSSQTRRELQGAVLRVTLRSPAVLLMAFCALVCLASAALAPRLSTFVIVAGVVLLFGLSVAGPPLALRRARPLREMIRAAVSPDCLVVEQARGQDTLPWTSFRSCVTTRRAIVLVLRSRRLLALPRDLFPAHELILLQQSVRAAQSAPPQ